MSYKKAKLNLTALQQKKAIAGHAIRMTKNNCQNGQLVMLHPMNYKKVMNSKGGINLVLSQGEMTATASHHGLIKDIGEPSGEGIFSDIWSVVKKGGKFLKDSGALSAIANALVPVLSTYTSPPVALAARAVLKNTTGIGLKSKKKTIGTGLYL